MNRVFSKTSGALLALGIVCLYMALAFVAPGCSFAHAAPAGHDASSGGHHQHSAPAAHSSLCFWACQATSDIGPVTHAPAVEVLAAQSTVSHAASTLVASDAALSLHARAPPVSARG